MTVDRPEDERTHVEAARTRFGPQADVQEIIAYLRSDGLSILEAIKAIMELRGIGLAEAKRLVHFSRAYADQRPTHEALHRELLEAPSADRAAEHDLHQAVEHVYAVFGSYRLPARIEYCDHCVSTEENAILQQIPMRHLTAEHLERYAWKSLQTWGAEADFKHFLPRLLDLLVTGNFDDDSLPWSLINKISCHSTEWPPEERDAISALLPAWWVNTLARYPAPHGAATVLNAISASRADAQPYLAVWEGEPTEASARHLADFLTDWMHSVAADDAWFRTVEQWITGLRPGEVLEAATLAASTPQIATGLSKRV
jgi:hypothetical protein